MIRLQNIVLSYPSKGSFLKVDELQIKAGEMVALIGLNGSGKSSLLKAISGSNPNFEGDISILERKLSDIKSKELSKYLSVVLTESPYPQLMPLEEFVAFGRYPFTNWWGKQKDSDKAAIQSALADCQLEYLSGKSMGELSDGERQRALIARALTQQSDFLILDEPSTHLDGLNTLNILKLLQSQAKMNQKAVLISSHKILESLQLVDKLWVIWEGKVMEYLPEEFSLQKEIQTALMGEHFDYDSEKKYFKVQIGKD